MFANVDSTQSRLRVSGSENSEGPAKLSSVQVVVAPANPSKIDPIAKFRAIATPQLLRAAGSSARGQWFVMFRDWALESYMEYSAPSGLALGTMKTSRLS